METEFIERVDEIDMDILKSNYKNQPSDYVGKFIPTKVVIKTRIPDKWTNSLKFRNKIWKKINSRLVEGQISEIDETIK